MLCNVISHKKAERIQSFVTFPQQARGILWNLKAMLGRKLLAVIDCNAVTTVSVVDTSA